jgi:hypothetical protein
MNQAHQPLEHCSKLGLRRILRQKLREAGSFQPGTGLDVKTLSFKDFE